MTEIKTNAIPHRQRCIDKQHPYIGGARDIYDDAKGKSQAEVNADVDDTFALHQSEINALNSQNYVTVATYSALPATGSADTIYRVSSYDGTQVDDTVYSEYAWNGSAYVHLSTKTQIGEVFDISAYHATGGTLAKYANLTAALGTNGANIPQSLRKGGMSVKYVQTSDNKYVQCRYMSSSTATADFTNVNNWQGVDAEPTAGSRNLVESGGVKDELAFLEVVSTQHLLALNPYDYSLANGYISGFSTSSPEWTISSSIQHVVIPISDFNGANSIKIVANETQTAYVAFLSSYNVVEGGDPNIIEKASIDATHGVTLPIPLNTTHLYLYGRNGNTYYLPSAIILADDVKSLELDLASLKKDVFPFNYAIKGYINYQSVIEFTPTLEANKLLRFPVIQGKTYTLYVSGSALHASPYFIWGTDGDNVIGTRIAYTLGENRITVPNGVSYLWVNAVFNGVGSIANFELYSVPSIYDNETEILRVGTELNSLETSFTKEESPNLFNGTVQNGYINPSSGQIEGTSYSQYKVSGLIPVQGNTYYSVTLSQLPSSKVGRCLNSNDEPLQLYDVYGEGGLGRWSYYVTYNETTRNAVIKTPENAVYLQFTLDLGNNISHPEQMMVEEIGSSYDPSSFVPTPYYAQGSYIYNLREQNLPEGIEERVSVLEEESKKVLKVLLIGSSFGMQTIAQFPALAKTGGIDVVAGNLYTGAITLENVANYMQNDTDFEWYAKFDTRADNPHWVKAPSGSRTADYAFADEEWDVVIVQRDAANMPNWTSNMSTALDAIIEHIKSECDYNPKIMFNSGFAYPMGSDPIIVTRELQEQRSENINSTALEMQEEYQLDIIPTCTAIQNARLTSLTTYGTWTDKDLASDYMHLDYGIGCYVAACTLYEFLIGKYFNRSVLTVPYLPVLANRSDTLNSSSTNFTEVTEAMSKIAKYCAMSAVLHPFEFNMTLAEKYAQ